MKATALAHPNVALIKYWGKSDSIQNHPAVASLSLTLEGLETRTSIRFDSNLQSDQIQINGIRDDSSLQKVTLCLDVFRKKFGKYICADVKSTNNFPTAAGLASSASGYAALVKAADSALGLELDRNELANIACLGSGSAPRSIYPGIVLLQPNHERNTIVCETISDVEQWPLSVVIAITTEEPKSIPSTYGMEVSRNTSPYYENWLISHPADLQVALTYIENRDFNGLAEISEQNCLKMHAVAMSSDPPLIYWSGVTIELMSIVRQLRQDKIPVFFTTDAGPQLKAICLPDVVSQVQHALQSVSGVQKTIISTLGLGARGLSR
ncbi:MAG: diphosphomevalonate decarboxylase [Pseudomonadota bacterium]|nr:diphosphomevalonate decarboxylase [Pseudomonadota bacterium]